MRFHKFERTNGEPVWIDLDAIFACHPSGPSFIGHTSVMGAFWSFTVKMPVPDVLALIEGPRLEPAVSPEVRMPPPDTYEEELAREKAARIDELTRFQAALLAEYPFAEGSWCDTYIARRRAELGGGKA